LLENTFNRAQGSILTQILDLSQQATFLTRNQVFEAYLTAENRVNDIGARSELTATSGTIGRTLKKETKIQVFVQLGLIDSLYDLAYEVSLGDRLFWGNSHEGLPQSLGWVFC